MKTSLNYFSTDKNDQFFFNKKYLKKLIVIFLYNSFASTIVKPLNRLKKIEIIIVKTIK